jgi:hypothetical protein
MSFFYLEVIKGNPAGKRWLLSDGAISIGRNSENTIIMPPSEKSVSGHHLIIYKTAERLLIQDLQSTNGTYLNEEKITETEMALGDILGFGKTGPRLKLIVSDAQLELGQSIVIQPGTTKIAPPDSPTVEDARSARSAAPEPTEPIDPFAYNMLDESSRTMQMEKKLMDKRMGSSDLHQLMKDGKRLEKIVDRGNISATQSMMLKASYKSNKKTQRQWLIIVGIIAFVSVSAIAFFSIRAMQYKSMLHKGLSLEQALDKLEQSIADAQKEPEANRARLKQLMSQYEKTQGQLTSVKSQLSQNDVTKFYSDPLEEKIDRIISRFGQSDYHIPPQMTERVRHHINVFSGNLHGVMARYLQRREQYYPMIARVFKDKKLPEALGYVSMLESGFNPMALSPVGARGMWQFMVATGQKYGLRVNEIIDERTDPEKATYAAAEYFKDLIGIFGGTSSVMLAMAAYNAGEGRVMGALKKIDDPLKDRDFWYLYRMGYLPEETKEYIPRVVALIIISENPAAYGFGEAATIPESLPPETSFIKLEDLEQ